MDFVPSFGKLKRRLRVLKIKNNEKTKRLRIATNKKHANDLQWKRKRANILKKMNQELEKNKTLQNK